MSPNYLSATSTLSSAHTSLFLSCNPSEMHIYIHDGISEAQAASVFAHSKHAISPAHEWESSAADRVQPQRFRTSQGEHGRQKKWSIRTGEPAQTTLQREKKSMTNMDRMDQIKSTVQLDQPQTLLPPHLSLPDLLKPQNVRTHWTSRKNTL